MAAIYLIRHGQASFGSADYDKLSDKGHQQALMLGKYWRFRKSPGKLYCGDLLRHNQTHAGFIQGLNAAAMPVISHSGFNEFDHIDILNNYHANWQDFAKISQEINQQSTANKSFQIEFSQAMSRWVFGNKNEEYQESWPTFKARCIRALQDVISQELQFRQQGNNPVNEPEKSNDILIFTSAGTISVLVQHILKLSDQQTLAVNQQIRNTSVTKLLFSEEKLSVDYLNNYSHLEQAGDSWVTFR